MSDDLIDSPQKLYAFLRASGIKILDNMIFPASPGHQVWELDYFLRMRHLGVIPRDGRYLWVHRPHPVAVAMAETYAAPFAQYNLKMLAHVSLHDFAYKVTRMVPEFGIDCGLSHVKNSVKSREGTYVGLFFDDLHYYITNELMVKTQTYYSSLHAQSDDFDPWTPARPAIEGPLAGMLGAGAAKYAVVHFRTKTGNGGTEIPAENLLPTLGFLRDNGFAIVKIGTEKCPEEFLKFGVINYAESELRNFKNDLALLANCKFALINASGLENLPDVMNIPLVTYGRWHLTLVPFSRRCVKLPTLMFSPERNRLLTFSEQVIYFRTRREYWEGPYFEWNFPLDRFAPRGPLADELLAATQEALATADAEPEVSPLQQRYRDLDSNGNLGHVKSRVSQFFLERFSPLL